MAISGLNRIVIADESGALTGLPLASARAAAEQVATEKVTEAKTEIRSAAVQAAEQAATDKVAAVKSEAVQAAKDSVQSAVADAIAPVVSTTIPAAVESGVREHAGAVADERIQATVPGMIQSQAATVVESQLNDKLPTAVQAAAGSEITRQIDERVTPTIEAKVSSVITEKSASIKDEVVQSVNSSIDGKIESVVTPKIDSAFDTKSQVLKGDILRTAGSAIDSKIESAKPGIVQEATTAAGTAVDSKIEAAKPAIVQAATESVTSALPAKISDGIAQAKGDIVKAAAESVSGTIDTKISEGIEQARTNIVSEALDSVDQTIDSKIDAAKTDILRESEKNITPVVARAIADANIGERNHGFGQRNISMVTYFWPDYYNRDQPGKVSQWDKALQFGETLGIVILNKSSGNWGTAVDNDFLTQAKLAEAAGAKYVAFYLQTRYGANSEFATPAYFERIRKNLNVSAEAVREDTEEYILAQVRNLVAWYKKGGLTKFAIFLDEVVNGWDEEQKAIMPYYKRLYGKIKEIAGQDTLVIINPGSNTRPEMMDACDIALTYESNAQKYIDAKVTDIHPRHYDGIPSWRFWHVVHGITKDNVDAVFAKADKAGIGHLYATDRTFAVGNGSEDEPDQNPYDKAPAEWVADRAKAWIGGVLPFEKRVSQLETVQVVNNRAYSLPEGTDIAWFFLLDNVTHPAGVTWQTKNGAAPDSGLVILVRAGEHLYGIVPGAVG